VSSGQQAFSNIEPFPAGRLATLPQSNAVQTRGRHEKKVACRLKDKGIETFLPSIREVHRWSDRNGIVEIPLFSCYTLVRMVANSAERLSVLQTEGVVRLVSTGFELSVIDPRQIDDIRMLLAADVSMLMYPFLKVGQRIRVRGGCLNGLEGILVSRPRGATLVISVDAIQRSIAMSLDGYQIEAA
jgi:transcriptional antiterminator NusG